MDFIDGLLNYLKENAPGQRQFEVSEETMRQYLPGYRKGVPEGELQEEIPFGDGIPMPEIGPQGNARPYIPEARQDNNGAFGPPRTMVIRTADGRRAMARTDGKGGDPKIIRYLPQQKGSMNV